MRFERKTIDSWWAGLQGKGLSLHTEMVWGFFFIGGSDATLLPLIPLLEARGYEYVTIFGKEAKRYLHVQLAERTTQAALHARVLQLHELGQQHEVEFDG